MTKWGEFLENVPLVRPDAAIHSQNLLFSLAPLARSEDESQGPACPNREKLHRPARAGTYGALLRGSRESARDFARAIEASKATPGILKTARDGYDGSRASGAHRPRHTRRGGVRFPGGPCIS